MTAPTGNAARRAACRYCGGAGRFQVVSPVSDGAWASCFCSRPALAAAIPPEQDGYAEGRAREGFVLVPRELTHAMLDATCCTAADDEQMRSSWAALLDAAPKIPTAQSTDRHAEGRIAGLEELERAATQGDWWVTEGSEEDGSIYIDAAENGERPIAMIMSGSPHNQDRADAAFIVAAVAFSRSSLLAHASRVGDRRGE